MSDEQLTPLERRALLALMVAARRVTNAELKGITGIELEKQERDRLNQFKLVASKQSNRPGRPFIHELTDSGMARCKRELQTTCPSNRANYGGILYSALGSLHRYTERNPAALADLFKPDIELLVRHAYGKLARRPQELVRLSSIRSELEDIPTKDLDAELLRMKDLPGVFLRAVTDQQELTPEERSAAIRVGGQDRHSIEIEDL